MLTEYRNYYHLNNGGLNAMKHTILAVILAIVISLGLGGCAGGRRPDSATQNAKDSPTTLVPSDPAPSAPEPSSSAAKGQHGYLARFTNQVIFIQLVDNGGQFSGQFQIAQTDSFAAVSSQNYPVTGTRNGKDVSITLTGSVWTTGWTAKTFTGTLSGDQLTLVMPGDDGQLSTIVLKAANVGDYNKAVTAVKQVATQQQQAQQAAQAAAKAAQDAANERARQQRTVLSANDAVKNALLRLASDRDGLVDNPGFGGVFEAQLGTLNQMRVQFADVQQQAARPLTCYQRNQLEYQVNQIEYDLNQIGYQVNQAGYIKERVTRQLTHVRDDIQQLQRSWERLQAAVKANTTGTPAPGYTADDIQAAIKAANDKVTAASATLQQSVAKSDDYYNQGKALLSNARDFMSKVKCSD